MGVMVPLAILGNFMSQHLFFWTHDFSVILRLPCGPYTFRRTEDLLEYFGTYQGASSVTTKTGLLMFDRK